MDLWHVFLRISDDEAQAAQAVLDADEQARARAFHKPEDRTRYIAAHAALRHVLARAADCAPQQLRFILGAQGKPALDTQATGDATVEFNLSHSGDHAVIATSRVAPLGVDIELLAGAQERYLDMQHVFSELERELIAECEPADRPLASYRCWVRKEALIKAVGCGFSDDVRLFSVSVGAEPRLLASAHPEIVTGRWYLAAFDEPGLWTGAVASLVAPVALRQHHVRWPELLA